MKYLLILIFPILCFAKDTVKDKFTIDERIAKMPNVARAIELCELSGVNIHSLKEVEKWLSERKEKEIECLASKTEQVKEEINSKFELPREKVIALEYLKGFDCDTLGNNALKAICIILK